MTRRTPHSIAVSATLLALALGTVAADAQTIRVRCDTFPNRSRASVDGSDLAAGAYSAVLTSGGHVSQSPPDVAARGEVQFDFDSNRNDVQQGATKIGRHFIVDDMATGTLLDANGNVVATQTRQCKVH